MHPTFLIIGPPKCASTSLHYYLGQHPQVYVSKIKETHFFTHDYHKGIAFYEHYFDESGSAKAIGEATPAYSFLPFAAGRIQTQYPQIKTILCFRNPMERAFSNWLMLSDAGIEKAGFREAIELNIKQLEYINFEGEKGAQIWNSRTDNIGRGEKWVRIYIQAGMYAAIMKTYMNLFKAEQIKYVFMEDLKYKFDETIKDLFSFIGVDNNFTVPAKKEQNFYYDRKAYRTVNKLIGTKTTRLISKHMPEKIKTIFKQKKEKVSNVPELSPEDRQFLWEIYRDEITELEKISGRDLSQWNPKAHIKLSGNNV